MSGKRKKVNVPHVEMMINVMLVDTRCIPVFCHLAGRSKVPGFLIKEGQKINWPVDGIRKKCIGIIQDVHPESMSICFPFMEETDAIASQGPPVPLSFGDIIDLFKRFDPALQEITRGAR